MPSFVPGLESGSPEPEASRVAEPPDGALHSTVVAEAAATACGGLFGVTSSQRVPNRFSDQVLGTRLPPRSWRSQPAFSIDVLPWTRMAPPGLPERGPT